MYYKYIIMSVEAALYKEQDISKFLNPVFNSVNSLTQNLSSTLGLTGATGSIGSNIVIGKYSTIYAQVAPTLTSISSQNGGIVSITRNSAGIVTITYKIFTSAPFIQCTRIGTLAGSFSINSVGVNSCQIYCFDQTQALADIGFMIMISGILA